ncbi:unnamed protein product [Lasius platythorax]|uniref:Uncharacterized protein n=1 Tax=Lasius platythorax TaxID=488582 RepID=A0AAV2P9L8_9HYME
MMRKSKKTTSISAVPRDQHHVWLNFAAAFLATSIPTYPFVLQKHVREMDETDLRFTSLRKRFWFRLISIARIANVEHRSILITLHVCVIVSVYSSFRKYIGCLVGTDW